MGGISEGRATFKGHVFCQLFLAIIFITVGLVVALIQALMYITIRPLNAKMYRKMNYYVTYMLNSQFVFWVEWWSGSRSFIYSNPEHVKEFFGNEHALMLLNHGCEVDFVMGATVVERVGVLGNLRFYIRMDRIAPVLGWSWKFQEIIFLDKNWEKNLGKQLGGLVDYPDPIWLTLVSEGTRYTEEKYTASMQVARDKGLPVLKHHLLPRTKGFVASIPYLKGKVPAIYDAIFVVDKECKNQPSLLSLLKGLEVRTVMLLRRIPMTEVPDDEKEAAEWLHKLYQKKDKVLDNYIKFGEFVPKNELDKEEYTCFKNFEKIELPRRCYTLVNFCFWAVVIAIPLFNYLYQTIVSGSTARISIVALLFAADQLNRITWTTYELIKLTQIDKGSTYGSASPTPSSSSLHNGSFANSKKSNRLWLDESTKVENKLD